MMLSGCSTVPVEVYRPTLEPRQLPRTEILTYRDLLEAYLIMEAGFGMCEADKAAAR